MAGAVRKMSLLLSSRSAVSAPPSVWVRGLVSEFPSASEALAVVGFVEMLFFLPFFCCLWE